MTSCSGGSPKRAYPPSRPATSTGQSILATWKTLLPCAKDEEAVVEYLRSDAPAFLAPLAPAAARAA